MIRLGLAVSPEHNHSTTPVAKVNSSILQRGKGLPLDSRIWRKSLIYRFCLEQRLKISLSTSKFDLIAPLWISNSNYRAPYPSQNSLLSLLVDNVRF